MELVWCASFMVAATLEVLKKLDLRGLLGGSLRGVSILGPHEIFEKVNTASQ